MNETIKQMDEEYGYAFVNAPEDVNPDLRAMEAAVCLLLNKMRWWTLPGPNGEPLHELNGEAIDAFANSIGINLDEPGTPNCPEPEPGTELAGQHAEKAR